MPYNTQAKRQAYARKWRALNRAKFAAYNRKWKLAHPEAVLAQRMRRWKIKKAA